VLDKIICSSSVQKINDETLFEYLSHLKIGEELEGVEKIGDVIVRRNNSIIDEILNIRILELKDSDVCCIGVWKTDSIPVYNSFKNSFEGEKSSAKELYKTLLTAYEDDETLYFLFVSYISLKYAFTFEREGFQKSLRLFRRNVDRYIARRFFRKIRHTDVSILITKAVDFSKLMEFSTSAQAEADNFLARFFEVLKLILGEGSIQIPKPKTTSSSSGKTVPLRGELTIGELIKFLTYKSKASSFLDIKHIHKIKGLEFEQVILQKTHQIPHSTNRKAHDAIFNNTPQELTVEEVFDYIQELNKLYVMFTRTKNNLYIVVDLKNLPQLFSLEHI
jgi:superfamily I DNA/RNA helicase